MSKFQQTHLPLASCSLELWYTSKAQVNERAKYEQANEGRDEGKLSAIVQKLSFGSETVVNRGLEWNFRVEELVGKNFVQELDIYFS